MRVRSTLGRITAAAVLAGAATLTGTTAPALAGPRTDAQPTITDDLGRTVILHGLDTAGSGTSGTTPASTPS